MMLALAIYAALATLAAVLFASLRRPHEATRAEWQRAIAENYGLRDEAAQARAAAACATSCAIVIREGDR